MTDVHDELTLQEKETLFGSQLNQQFPVLWPCLEQVIQGAGRVFAGCPPLPVHEISDSELASRTLMARLITDLYAVCILAWKGYLAQTVALTSSTLETAYLLTYIGLNDKTARQWLDHLDATQQIVSVFNLIQGSLSHLDHPTGGLWTPQELEEHTKSEYHIYQQMCGVKHLNAAMQMPLGLELRPGEGRITVGPQFSETFFNVTLWTLYHAARMALQATDAFARGHAPVTALAQFKNSLPATERLMADLLGYLDRPLAPSVAEE